MEKSLNSYFNSIDSSRISHSFLIGNTNFDIIKNDLNNLFLSDIFNLGNGINDNPDILVINPDNNLIKKENVELIHEFVKNTSQLSGKKIYIINKCECMNKQAANSLLKILEEPQPNIYAFLITSNFNDVLSTITSRCQKIFISTVEENLLLSDESLDTFNISFKIVKLIEKYHVNALPYVINLVSNKVDKKDLSSYIIFMQLIYKDLFNLKYKNKLVIFTDYVKEFNNLFNMMNSDNIFKKLIILENSQQNLDKNLNIMLFLDKLILDLGRSDL